MPRRSIRSLSPALACAALAGVVVPRSVEAISMTYRSRENRDITDEPVGINRRDCLLDEQFTFDYTTTAADRTAGDVSVWVGTACNVKENRSGTGADRCVKLMELTLDGGTFLVGAQAIVGLDAPRCGESEGSHSVWLMVLNSAGDLVGRALATAFQYDTDPPNPPLDVEGRIGETRVYLSWSVADESDDEEHRYFRVLCDPLPSNYTPCAGADADADADAEADVGADVEADVEAEADADATLDLDTSDVSETPDIPDVDDADADVEAEADADADLSEGSDVSPDESPDGGPGTNCSAAGAFREGDETDACWYCSTELASSYRSYTVDHLTNGVQYHFAVAALDDFKNPSAVSEVVCVTPKEVIDFWETYRGAGGGAQTGCGCAVVPATTAWMLIVAGAWAGFLTALWIRARRAARRSSPGRRRGIRDSEGCE